MTSPPRRAAAFTASREWRKAPADADGIDADAVLDDLERQCPRELGECAF